MPACSSRHPAVSVETGSMDRSSAQPEPEASMAENRPHFNWLGTLKGRSHILEHYLECQEPALKQALQEWLRVGQSKYPQHSWPFVAARNPSPYRFALISPDGQQLFYFLQADSDADLALKVSHENPWVTFPEVVRLHGSMSRLELWRLLQPDMPFLEAVLDRSSTTNEPDALVTPGNSSGSKGDGLTELIKEYRTAGERRDDGSFTLSDNYRKRFLATRWSSSPNQTILDRWKDVLNQLRGTTSVELRGGGFLPTRLIFGLPPDIHNETLPAGGELFDLLLRPHREANPMALTLSAMVKALFEKGARKVSWRFGERETVYLPDGGCSYRKVRSPIPQLTATGILWKEADELQLALKDVHPGPASPWDANEPTIYLKGDFTLEQGPWPGLARATTVELDRPFSLLIYLNNTTGYFSNGSVRIFWPEGQYTAVQTGSLPADVVVLCPAAPQRDPSLQRLSNPDLLDDIDRLVKPHIKTLLDSLKQRPLEERVHYLTASIRMQDLNRSKYGAYWRQLMELPVFRTVTSRELSIFEICQVLLEQGFLGEAQLLETVCPSLRREYLFRSGEFPNLLSRQIGSALSRVDGTNSTFQCLGDLVSAQRP